MMKTKIIIGYAIGIIGLIILFFNASVYLSNADFTILPSGVLLIIGLLFCMIGSILIKKNKNIASK